MDGADVVCDEKMLGELNALPEKRPPLLLDVSGLQIEKLSNTEPTSEAAVVFAGAGVMVDVAVDGVPNPPKMELAFELAVGEAKLNDVIGEVTASGDFA